LCSIDVVGIIFRIIDMVLWAVAAKTFRGDFELLCAISECHEPEDPEKNANGFGGNVLDSTDIDGLSYKGRTVS